MTNREDPTSSRCWTVGEVARRLGGRLEIGQRGAGASTVLTGVQGIDEAGPRHLSFVSNRRYVSHLETTRAGVVILDPGTDSRGRTAIRVDDPYLCFSVALRLFHPPAPVLPSVHPRAVVDKSAVVEGAEIQALAYVGPGARVGKGTIVAPGAHVGRNALVGRDCRLMPNSVVCDGSVVGDRVILNPGAVVGGEGFGFVPTDEGWVKIPQTGLARIHDDVEIGSNSCVDRAAVGETCLGRGAKLDNLVQVGHGAHVGEHNLLVSYAGIAGSSRLGSFVTLAAKAGVLGHLQIGDGVKVGARGLVTSDVAAGTHVSGYPAFSHSRWRRAAVIFKKLPEILKRIAALESRVGRLEQRLVGERRGHS